MIDRTHKLSLARQAKALGISRSSVYYLPRPVSDADLKLMRRVGELHLEYPFAGSRMLKGLLNDEGHEVGRCHVATLMKGMGVAAIYRRPLAIVSPTVCGWLPRGEGVVRVWRLVGRGHVYGVEDAAPWLRALRSEASNALRPREMPNAGDRVQIDGTRSKARRSEPGVPNAVSPSVAITSSRRRRAFSHLVAPEARFQREAPHRLDAEADPGCFVQAVLAR